VAKRLPLIKPGDRFGRWTVIGEVHRREDTRTAVMCRCDCGTERDILTQTFLRVAEQPNISCGCWRRERTAVNIAQTRWKDSHGAAAKAAHGSDEWVIYKTWKSIRRRCDDKTNEYYHGRGIRVYEPWHDDSSAFIVWMMANLGPRPDGTSLDRVDNNGNYEPGNLRWATPSQQARNRRAARLKRG
jgi:hypothetical protein